RASVQLGLLCLSLFISSLDGEEIDSENSMAMPVNMDEDMEDFPQFQVAENEQERNLLSHDSDIIPVTTRVKRQTDNTGERQRKKPKPGMFSVLAKVPSQVPASSEKIITA
ncbi:hypothetical protein IRJ41_016338, partial [Triplophysa rosa]